MALSKAAAKLITEKLMESIDAGDISHNDLQRWLSDAVSDLAQPNQYCYLVDFIGDGESGDVIFSCSGDMKKAPYQVTTVNGKVTCAIEEESIVDVLPHTTYEEEADEADHYASMEAAKLYRPGTAKLAERFVSKTARDAADSSSFAGKGKSFPILKSSDVMAAVRSIGRAGSDNYDPATLKANITRIAKAKGFAGSLPKAWRGGDAKEAAAMESQLAEAGARHSAADMDKIQAVHDHSIALGATCPAPSKEAAKTEAATGDARGTRLIESAALSTAFTFKESAALSPLVKIISPGRGSSGFYTKEVLERDGPQIFGRGTLMFVNHATEAEQKSRPEGDWSKLAAVTEAAARWDENGPEGPALYAPAAVFSKWAEEVKEKAPYTGVSINAYGQYAESVTGLADPKVKYHESKMAPDGKPGLIAKLTAADSIDLVTKAGRDGKLLLESATAQPPNQTTEGGADMDAADFNKLQESNAALLAEVKKLQESNAEAITEGKKLRERRFIEEGTTEVNAYLKTVSVSEAVKDQVIRRLKERFALPGGIPLTEAGAIDAAKVKVLAEAETNDELAFLRKVNPNLVTGMGTTAAKQLTEAERASRLVAQQKQDDEDQGRFASVMGFGQVGAKGRKVLAEGRRAFDVHYNSRLNGSKDNGGGLLTMEEN